MYSEYTTSKETVRSHVLTFVLTTNFFSKLMGTSHKFVSKTFDIKTYKLTPRYWMYVIQLLL